MTSTAKYEKSLWDIAVDQNNAKNDIAKKGEKNPNLNSEETSIFVMGSKASGKSTIILRFLDKEETPKPTVALDYTFGRKTKGHNMTRDIGHIWELGGGTNLAKLVGIPLSTKNISSTAILLVLDLSKPHELWNTMETLLKSARNTVDKLLTDLKNENPELLQRIQADAWKRVGEQHQDKNFLDPFPIPFAIVGTKYDIYQDFDPEKRKMVSRTLRFIAHSNGAHLQCFSAKAEGLVTRTRGMFSSLLFHSSLNKGISTDHNKPIIVPAGSDTFASIGSPPVPNDSLAKLGGRSPFDLWKSAYASVFPPEKLDDQLKNEDITHNPQYAESAIDLMRAQKDELYTLPPLLELERYKRQAERKANVGNRSKK